MTAPAERAATVNGERCRVFEKGTGEPLGFLPTFWGLPAWTPFLDRLAERRRVIAPSLPGFPGGLGHHALDDLPDWLAATLDLLEQADLEGADLIGHGVGGALAAEVAALSRATVRRLVLIAPLGLFDASEPVADVWARRRSEVPGLHSARPEEFARRVLAPPEGADEVEWQVSLARAGEAAARLLWPTGDRGLRKRLHRIEAPTLILFGAQDRIVPASYAKRFADGMTGPVEIRSIEAAGHRVDFDAPEVAASAILEFLEEAG